jgi:hypothetical protein
MNNPSFTPCNLIIAGLGLFVAAILPISAEAADGAADKSAPTAAVAAKSLAAAGAVEDSLQACQTRIPKDASIGQRLIAEQSCARDENDRKAFQHEPAR